MTKRVNMSEVGGERDRPPNRWKNGVKKACAESDMGVDEARRVCLDQSVSRSMTDGIV